MHAIVYYTMLYTRCSKKYISEDFCNFLSSCLEFQSKILQTYLVILCTRTISSVYN